MNEARSDQLMSGDSNGLAGSNMEMARAEPSYETENESGRRQGNERLRSPTQDDQGMIADRDIQSDDGFEVDPDSSSDISDTSSQMEIDNHQLDDMDEWNHFQKNSLKKRGTTSVTAERKKTWTGVDDRRQSPLVSSEHFNWNLTGQAGSAWVEPRHTHPLRKGGIAYAQLYNVNKDLFATASKRDQGLFGEPQLEGLTCPPSLLDAWIVAARQYRNAGIATASKAAPQLKPLRKAFESMKARIRHALDASPQTSFSVREEYRIS
ncbi:Fc.00g094440.m01.CDS01 [Cosmosporella sp. VM-42]